MKRLLLAGALARSMATAGVSASKQATPVAGLTPPPRRGLPNPGIAAKRCPCFKQAMAGVEDPGQEKRLGVDGVRCATYLKDTDSAGGFVRALKKQFPRDPEVLYLAVHVFSDLSVRASNELSIVAPGPSVSGG